MTKSATVQVRMNPEIKLEGEKVLGKFGLSPSALMNMVYTYMIKEQTIPFELRMPNAETLEAIRQVRSPEFQKTAKRYNNFDEILAELED